jgi:taurine dioxygenase
MKVKALSPAMGAEITGIDLSMPLDDSRIVELRAIWLEYQMIVIRGQNLTPVEQLAFAKALGEPDIYPFLTGLDGFPMITEVLKKEDERVNFGGVWHSDTTYQKCPPMATLLYAKELPPLGGDTLFANQYEAFANLSAPLRHVLEQLRAVNAAGKKRVASTRSERLKDSGSGVNPDDLAGIHPVVRTHPETGRKALFVNAAHTINFEGWSAEESQGLLEYLFAHQISPEFQCRLSWQVGDVAFWDNRCVQHYPLNDYHGHRRLLHRITLKGDTPR